MQCIELEFQAATFDKKKHFCQFFAPTIRIYSFLFCIRAITPLHSNANGGKLSCFLNTLPFPLCLPIGLQEALSAIISDWLPAYTRRYMFVLRRKRLLLCIYLSRPDKKHVRIYIHLHMQAHKKTSADAHSTRK